MCIRDRGNRLHTLQMDEMMTLNGVIKDDELLEFGDSSKFKAISLVYLLTPERIPQLLNNEDEKLPPLSGEGQGYSPEYWNTLRKDWETNYAPSGKSVACFYTDIAKHYKIEFTSVRRHVLEWKKSAGVITQKTSPPSPVSVPVPVTVSRPVVPSPVMTLTVEGKTLELTGASPEWVVQLLASLQK